MATQKHIETQRANYWGLGWVAFPISVSWNVDRNKKDLCPPPNWQNLTLESAKQLPLRSSLGQGLAIQTGQLSGIIVLDIDDVGKWNEFLVGKGQETPGPDTVTARSQRGGLHLYFRWIDALSDIKSTSALLGGCADVRSTGGMIIAPPTSFLVPGETERRRYSWLEGKSPWECELGDMPVWLAEALRSSGGCSHKKSTGTKVALDGPDTMATPDVIKEFIAEHFLGVAQIKQAISLCVRGRSHVPSMSRRRRGL
ncbi:hypothetical protein M427DRAFT_135989 [Gonapodya prolifera JEL478]|uniref:DNA primase/polymerase bifunctional N-terminal domain-containing protein n=1 Tax=Gonapodya prolifera (strain JEL478) TaxID=1344416 RepID=A0A139ABH3_GONPJ|nr:hypothetical protein M427DRAFT_135989 [Gonapodya prolifera JEL478]|eukprot:KXS14110.1 hypothetical protein M427DRAFT_135989 [Gonapodya prolifera JEL478]